MIIDLTNKFRSSASKAVSLEHLEEEIVPSVDGAGHAPMHAVIVERPILSSPVTVAARVAVWAQERSLRCVKEAELPPPLPPFPLRRAELIHLRRVYLRLLVFQAGLIAPKRPRPRAITPFVPPPVFVMGRGECAQKGGALVAL